MFLETQFIILLALASLIAIFARRSRVPYTIAMVLTGVAVSIFVTPRLDISGVSLTRHLILITFLPGLLFDAAFHLDLRELVDNRRPISTLAVPGIVISAVIVTVLVARFTALSVGQALLFGVLISATDPVAVLAIFKELGVPKRLGSIVEGESLFNDGTALVLFEIVLAVVLGEQAFTIAGTISQFFIVVAGGVALGLVTGLLAAQVMRRTDDSLIDMALTMVLAYGTFLVGEELHVSPVIAVVVAGAYVGNFAEQGGLSASTRLTLTSFWAYLAFLINSAIFLLIGLQVNLRELLANAGPVIFAVLAMLAARFVVIYSLGFVASKRSRRGFSLQWAHVLYWGGLRGSVSLALALSLPAELPNRDLIELMSFGAVFFSLVGQGLTMRPLLKVLKLTSPSELRLEYERRRGRWAMLHTALHAVDRLHEENLFSAQVRDRVKEGFIQQTNAAWEALDELTVENPELLGPEAQLVQRILADEQKIALQDMLRRGTLSEEIYLELIAEIDARVVGIGDRDWEVPPPAIPPRASGDQAE